MFKEASGSQTRTPFLDKIAISAMRIIERRNKASLRDVLEIAENHTNPLDFIEKFDDISRWDLALVDSNGLAVKPTGNESAMILVENNSLKLQVTHDAYFSKKSGKWRKGQTAAEKYNNAFIIGGRGFLPTERENIVIETDMQVSPDFHGSTGIWMEDQKTFDERGHMEKPFRSFGFSFLGDSSDPFIRGLAIETCLGFSIQRKTTVTGIDVTKPHRYKMVWKWEGQKTQTVDFFIDDQQVGSLAVDPMGPGEIQLWADNYKIKKGLQLYYLNVPEGTIDQNQYSDLKVSVVSVSAV